MNTADYNRIAAAVATALCRRNNAWIAGMTVNADGAASLQQEAFAKD